MSKLTFRNNNKGFTIIEVVLVLAIAGLIFLIVFLALPGLQRSRRDTQRKSDMGKVLAQLSNYASNNNGSYPANANFSSFCTTYLNSNDYKNPSTNAAYTCANTGAIANPPVDGTIYYATGDQCSSTNAFATATGGSGAAIAMQLEGGGVYCQAG